MLKFFNMKLWLNEPDEYEHISNPDIEILTGGSTDHKPNIFDNYGHARWLEQQKHSH